MIFSELYSAYYNTIAAIIFAVIDGERSAKELQKIVFEHAFEESVLTVLPNLENEKWQLLRSDKTTPLKHKPTMPLTTLQKQWLKAICLDPRIKLFGIHFPELDGIIPLFTQEDFRVYDKYGDGDPFEDEEYQRQFRVILNAIRQQTQVKFEMLNRKGNTMFVRCRPVRLEYSEKDDKFRIVTAGWRAVSTVNLAKIHNCVPYNGEKSTVGRERPPVYDIVCVRLTNYRNALERFLLHFAHFEKQAERLDQKHYLVKIKYSHDEEADMVIRILSFGPLVEVVEPQPFRNLVIEKLKKQQICELE